MKKHSDQVHEKLVRQICEDLDLDLLFESMAQLLINPEHTIDQLQVIPIDHHHRNYRNDVAPAPKEYPDEPLRYLRSTEDGFVQMHTSRPSILDYLPEDFYAEPDNPVEPLDELGNKRSNRDLERHRQEQKVRQKSAQQFFLPIEIACNRVRLEREQEEVALLENHDRLLAAVWEDAGDGSIAWTRFMRTRHLISSVMGDLKKTQALIAYVLGMSVELSLSQDACTKQNPEEILAVSKTPQTLGYNMRLGNEVYDYLPICTVRLKDLSTQDFYHYYTDSLGQDLLQTLVKHYFPIDVEVTFDFEINTALDPAHDCLPVLGFSTSLG